MSGSQPPDTDTAAPVPPGAVTSVIVSRPPIKCRQARPAPVPDPARPRSRRDGRGHGNGSCQPPARPEPGRAAGDTWRGVLGRVADWSCPPDVGWAGAPPEGLKLPRADGE